MYSQNIFAPAAASLFCGEFVLRRVFRGEFVLRRVFRGEFVRGEFSASSCRGPVERVGIKILEVGYFFFRDVHYQQKNLLFVYAIHAAVHQFLWGPRPLTHPLSHAEKVFLLNQKTLNHAGLIGNNRRLHVYFIGIVFDSWPYRKYETFEFVCSF